MTIARDIARSVGSSVRAGNIGTEGAITGQFSATIYDSTTDLPTSGVERGAQGYVSSNQRLYIRGTGGWYNIATINNTPTITSVADASSNTSPFDLANDGTTTTVVTITATDSEGFPITFSAVADAGFDSIATVSQDSSVFTITPFSEDSAGNATSGTLTFKASDGVNIASEVATFTLTFAVEQSKFTTLLLKASGDGGTNTTINDASTNTNAITITGNAVAQAFTPHHPTGYSFQVVDNSNAIVIDSGYFTTNTSWWTSSGFTMEGWINISSSDNSAIWDNRSSSSSGWMLNLNNTTDKLSTYINGGFAAFDTSITRDEWHYIALTVSGTSANLYVDGKKDSTTATVANTASYEYFGKSQNTLGGVQYTPRQANGLEGFYRDFKFTAGVEYTGDTMTVPTSRKNSDSNTALFITMTPYLRDLSSNASTVATIGTTLKFVGETPYNHVKYDASVHGASVYFDGNDDLRTTGYTEPIGNGDYTVECWVYPTARNTSGAWLFQIQDGHAPSNANGIQVYYRNNSSSYNWAHLTNGSQYNTTTASQLNTWQHVALTRASGTTRLFINGVVIDTQTSDTYDASSYDDITIAKGYSDRALTGYMSDFRIINGTALYTSAFTPPTAPLDTTPNGTKYLTCNDTANIFNAAGTSNPITLTNDVESDTGVKKYTSSMLFDGTGDAISIGDDINLDFGSEDFTIEGWYKADTTTGDHYLISSSGGTFNAGPSHFGINIYQGNWRVGGFNDKLIGGIGSGVNTGIDTTNWHHFAWTQNTRLIQFFIDGVQTGSTVDVSSDTFDCGGSFIIGGYHSNSASNNWDGNLEDIRITKGLCRYPFIPQKTQLDATGAEFLVAHGASTTTESSSNNRTVTATGDPTMSNGPATGMKAIDFDGTGDYLLVDNCTEIGTSAFTFEMWVYFDTVGAYRRLWGNNTGSVTGSGTTTFRVNNSNTFEWWWSGSLAGSLAPVAAGQWYHIHLQRDSSNQLQFFLNGALVYEATKSDNMNGTNADKNYIGGHYNNGEVLDGRISNARLTIGTTYLKTKNFTPPTSELTA